MGFTFKGGHFCIHPFEGEMFESNYRYLKEKFFVIKEKIK